MPNKNIKLPITPDERDSLRRAKLKAVELAFLTAKALAERAGIPVKRGEYLVAIAQFQHLGSVGPASAQDLWDLGYKSVSQLASQDPFAMYQKLQIIHRRKMDPCVEDVFRCAVAQATYPDLPEEKKLWWNWGADRGKSRV